MKINDKDKLFFNPYLKEIIRDYKSGRIDISLCEDIVKDNIPKDNEFLLGYFSKFPSKIETIIFNLVIDNDLREILHDVVSRHALEYLLTC